MGTTEPQPQLIPLILSGGAGTRLWPVSRRAHPKPFMELADGETLAEKTFLRAKAVTRNAPVITVTSRDYYFYTRDLYAGLEESTSDEQFLLEPMGRNTAPAIALAELKHEAVEFHTTVHRPWGSCTIMEDADDCKVKRLTVKPSQVLSLQLHHRQSEHWTAVQGKAKVRPGNEEFLFEANHSTYIPVETLHRLENPGDNDVHLIEVQTGDYFGEDDIDRFEDIYGRINQ